MANQTDRDITKAKNKVATTAATFWRKNIELRLAQAAFETAQNELDKMFEPLIRPQQFQPPQMPPPFPPKDRLLYLVSAGANKIAVIKAVREITTLGLKEAKDLVDSSNATGAVLVGKFDAEMVVKAEKLLRAAGGTTKIMEDAVDPKRS